MQMIQTCIKGLQIWTMGEGYDYQSWQGFYQSEIFSSQFDAISRACKHSVGEVL